MARVAIAHDWLVNRRGAERVLREFCLKIDDLSIYTLFARSHLVDEAIRRKRIHVSPLDHLPGIARYYRYLLPLFPRAAEAMRVRDADLLVSVSHMASKGIPHDASVPHICYCLTPARIVWFPELYPDRAPVRDLGLKILSSRFKRWDLESNRGVDVFVAISETVRERLADLYGRQAEVIHPCVDLDFFAASDLPREDFYLTVSAPVPQKRLEIAVEAFNRLGRRLLVVGEGPLRRKLGKAARDNVEFLGWVSDSRLRELYCRARALIFPSFDEFGLSPVEAQACGCPVIAWRRGGVRETVVDGRTGILYDEATADSLVEAVRRLESDAPDPHACIENSKRFSRERFLSEWRRCFRSVGVDIPL